MASCHEHKQSLPQLTRSYTATAMVFENQISHGKQNLNSDISLYESSTDDLSDGSYYSDSSDSMVTLLFDLKTCDEDLIFAKHGYKKNGIFCDTLQGKVFNAITINTEKQKYVKIKKCDKYCYLNQISFADDDNMQFIVEDDIIKEKLILQYLNIDNPKTLFQNSIPKLIDFFHTETDYYLVTQHSDENINIMTLKQFTTTAHKYIGTGKLKEKQYQKIVKRILWDIAIIVHSLHNMRCVHLNLNSENITLENVEFVDCNGSVCINPEFKVKLNDFSQSEVFEGIDFSCIKYNNGSRDNVQYLSPQLVSEQPYDASLADSWALGMILYECAVGQPLYNTMDVEKTPEPNTGYGIVVTNNIKQYLKVNNLLRYLNPQMLSVITKLLTFNEKKRINSHDLLNCEWFKNIKSETKHFICNCKQTTVNNIFEDERMENFPFYQCY
eukprot:222352_1